MKSEGLFFSILYGVMITLVSGFAGYGVGSLSGNFGIWSYMFSAAVCGWILVGRGGN